MNERFNEPAAQNENSIYMINTNYAVFKSIMYKI